jgi:2-oxoglutarate ferredoxin oxidoreductase subunit alpha
MVCAYASHGDTKHALLIPEDPAETFDFAADAFDLADRLQTPVFVMIDLDIGMNHRLCRPLSWDDKRQYDRGKVLSAEELDKATDFGRYMDVDGDGIAWRTVPGDGLPAYFNRGSGHNARGQYSERADDYTANVDRLAKKFETARTWVPAEIADEQPGADVAIIAYGTTHWAADEARDQLRTEAGLATSYLRLRAYPFTEAVERFIDRHARVYVVEQNRDAQMLSLLKLDLSPGQVGKLRSVVYYSGLPIDARTISDEILAQERESK